ncbi:putative mitochondrial adenine nucleotide transporter BTL1 [Drosera capensis]
MSYESGGFQEKTTTTTTKHGVFGDVDGMVMLPKEVEVCDKAHTLQLQIQLPDFGKALKGFLETREVGEFLSGALAGAMAKAVLAPLETIRSFRYGWRLVLESSNIGISALRYVSGFEKRSVGPKDILGNFVDVFERKGLQGLWAGNAINMLRIVPTQAVELATFEHVKRAMTSAQEKWNQSEHPKLQLGSITLHFSLSWISPVAVAGAAAGIAATLVCHPLEVIKDRLAVRPDEYTGITVAIGKIYKDGGIRALYSGLSPTLIGMLPYSTSYYFIYETLKKSYCDSNKKKSLSRVEMLLLGALSGLTASTISFPLEVARKRLMVGALQGKCPPNMAASLAEEIREEGLLGLYRGWGASCLKVMPNSGISWMFYEAWKAILLLERRLL